MLRFNRSKLVSVFLLCIFPFFLATSCMSKTRKEYLNNELIAASRDGNLSKIKTFIRQGADIDAEIMATIGPMGPTALMEASRYGHIEIVKYLFEKGANINATDNHFGNNALIEASEAGHIEVIKYLLSNGMDIDAKGKYGSTALAWASEKGHIRIVKYLFEQGADINDKSTTGNVTALMKASRRGHLEVVKYLVENGADINAKDMNGQAPLSWAEEERNLDIIEYLKSQGAK